MLVRLILHRKRKAKSPHIVDSKLKDKTQPRTAISIWLGLINMMWWPNNQTPSAKVNCLLNANSNDHCKTDTVGLRGLNRQFPSYHMTVA